MPLNICETSVYDLAVPEYHLRDGQALTTLCGRSVTGGTMIPPEAWGNADSAWCQTCREKRQLGAGLANSRMAARGRPAKVTAEIPSGMSRASQSPEIRVHRDIMSAVPSTAIG
jgi:hypothetical protein